MIAPVIHKRASITAVISAMVMVTLDANLLNVALPTISKAMSVAPSKSILVASTYQICILIGLLPCAHFSEYFGVKKLFVGGLFIFSGASLACALAPSLTILVIARGVQGLGGAAIMALGVTLLRFALGPERLGSVIGWNALTIALCSVAGPMFGAFILALSSWPWLFLINLPISLVALAAAFSLPHIPTTQRSVDVLSVLLHASIAAMIFGASELAIAYPLWAAIMACGAILLASRLIRRVRSRQAPLWPIDLLASRAFRISVIASICCFIGQSAGLLALPFYLQFSLGQGAVNTGLIMTCWPMSIAVTSSLVSKLADRCGSAIICTVGASLFSAGLLLSALWPVKGSLLPLAIGAGLSGLGFGFFQVSNNRTLYLAVSPERSAAAGGMQGSARLIGQSTGALLTSLLLASTSVTTAPRLGFALAAIFALAAAVASALQVSSPVNAPSIEGE